MHIQTIYLWSVLTLACVTFGLYFVSRVSPARNRVRRPRGKKKDALVRARNLVGQMRRAAHSPDPEKWRQIDLLSRLIIKQSELGEFPLHEAGTSQQEAQKLKMLIADKSKKRAVGMPPTVETEAPAIVPIGEVAIELEPAEGGEELELDRASDTRKWPTPVHIIRLNPTASYSTSTARAAETLPHEWRESHEESLLANFDTLFERSFKV